MLSDRVKDFRAAAHRFGLGRRADRNDHALLKLQRALGVLAAVDHVHHRNGKRRRRRSAEIAKERQRKARRGGARDGERDAENRVRAEIRLCSA